MEAAVLFEALNAVLLVTLLYVYVSNYRQAKAPFLLGLVVFAAFLLVQNSLALYFHLTSMEYYSKEAMSQSLPITAAQTIALLVLNYFTWKG